MSVCSGRAVILLGSQRCSGTATGTGVLPWIEHRPVRVAMRGSSPLCEGAAGMRGTLP